MRQINFLIVFVFCIALVLFSLENSEPATIQIIEGLAVQAPLSIELILAMGIGAVLAWVFSVWARLQRLIESRQNFDQIRNLDARIQELEQDRDRYKTELEAQGRLLPATDAPTPETEKTEALANS